MEGRGERDRTQERERESEPLHMLSHRISSFVTALAAGGSGSGPRRG